MNFFILGPILTGSLLVRVSLVPGPGDFVGGAGAAERSQEKL
jgi:hypothetical protein